MNDWFKYYRTSSEHHLRSKPTIWIYWIHCLESAAWKTHEVFWDQQEFCLEQGSFITSMQRDSTKNGITIAAVRYARKVLASCNMLTINTTNKGTLITVNNWKDFQRKPDDETTNKEHTDDKPTTNEQQTNNKPTTTTEEGKERKEGKRRKRITTDAPEYSEAFEKFWKAYPKHEDKAEAWQLYREIVEQELEDEAEAKLLKFAYAYSNEFGRGRKRYAKKAKYILRNAEWNNWMSENHFEYHMGNETREEPDPTAKARGCSDFSFYRSIIKASHPNIHQDLIKQAWDLSIHYKTIIEDPNNAANHQR